MSGPGSQSRGWTTMPRLEEIITEHQDWMRAKLRESEARWSEAMDGKSQVSIALRYMCHHAEYMLGALASSDWCNQPDLRAYRASRMAGWRKAMESGRATLKANREKGYGGVQSVLGDEAGDEADEG